MAMLASITEDLNQNMYLFIKNMLYILIQKMYSPNIFYKTLNYIKLQFTLFATHAIISKLTAAIMLELLHA